MKFKNRASLNGSRNGGMKTPVLHGHTKITLTDVNTGKKEIVEKDNLVTNAVAQIFANNLFGALDYTKITPLRKMYGGVLCFQNALTQLASNVMPPNESTNHLVAHAGQTAHSTASTTRGNPNGVLSEVIQNGKGYKFVWDFSTSQGSGTIGALALTHSYGGDIGLKPIGEVANESLLEINSNKTLVSIMNSSTVHANYEEFYNAVILADLSAETGLHVFLEGSTASTKLIVNEVKLRTLKQDINGELGQADLIASHEVTLTGSFDKRYCAVCTDGSYIYVVQASSDGGSTLNIDKIDMTTWTATDISITDASLSLASERMSDYSDKNDYPNRVIISGGRLYWAKQNGLTFYSINLSNPADIVELTSTLVSARAEVYGMTEISEGLIVGANYLINGGAVYPLTRADRSVLINSSYSQVHDNAQTRVIKCGGKFLTWTYCYDSTYPFTIYSGNAYPLCYLATIQNLPSPITKTNDKTMQIEYSITLEEET
ncbi:MAG: hypothetical protein K6F83_01290 [Clostridiales bacterium]|nr:hypothetical protein [Clostridiales bacterium]